MTSRVYSVQEAISALGKLARLIQAGKEAKYGSREDLLQEVGTPPKYEKQQPNKEIISYAQGKLLLRAIRYRYEINLFDSSERLAEKEKAITEDLDLEQIRQWAEIYPIIEEAIKDRLALIHKEQHLHPYDVAESFGLTQFDFHNHF